MTQPGAVFRLGVLVRQQAWLAWWVSLVGLGAGCGVESATMIEIVSVPKPVGQTECLFRGDNPQTDYTGFYDPTGQDGFVLAMRIINHLVDRTFDMVRNDNADNLRPEANKANLLGFDTCFYREDDPALDITRLSSKGVRLVDCTALPAGQQRFIAASGPLENDGTTKAAVITVLRHADLKLLYGAGFDPPNIPPIGVHWDTSGTGGGAKDRIVYSALSQDPADPNRNAAWGAYPNTRVSRVVIQARLQAKLQSGWRVQSNEFHFPIDISVGTVANTCGEPYLDFCTANCRLGSCVGDFGTDLAAQRECVVTQNNEYKCSGTCDGSGELCLPYGFTGSWLATADQNCLVFQRGNPPKCTSEASTCNRI